MKKYILVFFAVIFLIAPARADLGDPARLTLVTLSLKDGTEIEGLLPVTRGGYLASPDQDIANVFVLTKKDGTAQTVSLTPHEKTQMIDVGSNDVASAFFYVHEKTDFVPLRTAIDCDAAPVRNVPLADIHRLTFNYHKTRQNHDVIVKKYSYAVATTCPRFFGCSGSDDSSCIGFIGRPAENMPLLGETLENLNAVINESPLRHPLPPTENLVTADAEITTAVRMLGEWSVAKEQDQSAFVQKIADIYRHLVETFQVTEIDYVHDVNEALLPPPAPSSH